MGLIITAELAYGHYLEKVHYNTDEYDEKRDKKVIRASNGGRCHRLQKYHLSDVEPKKLDKSSMQIFRIGDIFHNELQQGMKWLIEEKNKDKNLTLEMEKKVSVKIYGLEIEGHFDIRLFDHENKVIQITDIKTMNPRAFGYFKRDPYNKKGAIIQLGAYIYATKEEFPDYDLVVLLTGWDKDKGNFAEFEIDATRALKAFHDYYSDLSDSLELDLEDLVPIKHRFSPMEAWECNYCNYNHVCPSPKIKRV